MFSRLKSAARILIKGDPKKNRRNPIPSITKEEVAEIKQFFPREKFFIFGHARSGTTLLMRLARLHPEVHCNYQAHFFTRQPFLCFGRVDQRLQQGLACEEVRLIIAMHFGMQTGEACEKRGA